MFKKKSNTRGREIKVEVTMRIEIREGSLVMGIEWRRTRLIVTGETDAIAGPGE